MGKDHQPNKLTIYISPLGMVWPLTLHNVGPGLLGRWSYVQQQFSVRMCAPKFVTSEAPNNKHCSMLIVSLIENVRTKRRRGKLTGQNV